ncbi:hypothetical protein [Lactococcus lactis]|uniref:Uncharacterized protein n=1 Tax=Lactococcus lactis subsp. lactis A12 TaxID=1137134 RepID=S6FRP2_LACLL|nr:hypothetical protein [Lactococcus lactis]CDG03742.1 Putative uncharacterized protein [Lactococcus lactis subsp. lactis A12]SBW29605.1 Putative uncharacterized protein [Lactococcus lactis subsp. lactis]
MKRSQRQNQESFCKKVQVLVLVESLGLIFLGIGGVVIMSGVPQVTHPPSSGRFWSPEHLPSDSKISTSNLPSSSSQRLSSSCCSQSSDSEQQATTKPSSTLKSSATSDETVQQANAYAEKVAESLAERAKAAGDEVHFQSH